MPYPKHLLQPDEELVVDLKPHWWFFGKQILTAVPLVVALVLVSFGLEGTPRKWLLILWGLALVWWLGWLVVKFVDWNFTYFVVTTERVIFRTGFIAKRGVEIPLGRINNINFRQGVWERVIGAGDLSIESAGQDGQSLFEDVRHPDGVQQAIYGAIEDSERKRASWSAPIVQQQAAAVPVDEQIAQLARLRDAGHITAEEFEAKKQELLGRM